MKYIFLFTLLLSFSVSFAQHSTDKHAQEFSCEITIPTEELFSKYPEQRAIAQEANEALEEFTRSYIDSPLRDDDLVIIPVVFHIIHANGSENISYEQIESAIDVLNADFKALNNGLNTVVSEFQDRIANVNFEFRLARLDPDGNCTNGVIRTYDNATFEGGENLKSISPSWGRESYLNVWVCNSIESGAAGYALLPGSVNGSFGAAVDGIVILHNYLGDMGTSSASLSHSLTHEVGHWANLSHTWGNSNNPGLPGNCNGDDGITDTPPTIGWTSCNLDGATCGSLDNVENFMEYSYCSKMFTTGQKNRMRATMNSGISQRNQLSTPANLTETGVLAAEMVCEANFTTEGDRIVCPGQEIEFTDMSYNGVTTWEWTFPGGTPATSNQQFPIVTYDSPGDYTVTLTAGNANSSESVTKAEYITVLSSGENSLPFSEGFESFSSFETNDGNWTVINQGTNSAVKWEINNDVAYDGSISAYVNGRNNDFGNTEYLQSPTYDLTGLSQNAVIKFRYAHAKRSLSSDDELKVQISKNCGENWSQRLSLDGTDLPTVSSAVSGDFVPSSQSDWTEVEIANISSTYFTESFRFRFMFTSRNGNNIYIDNINLYDPVTVGIDPVDFIESMRLFPNPTTGRFTLDYNLRTNGITTIDVLDISGRLLIPVFEGNSQAGMQTRQIDLSHLDAGIYFVRLGRDGQQIMRRVVLQK